MSRHADTDVVDVPTGPTEPAASPSDPPAEVDTVAESGQVDPTWAAAETEAVAAAPPADESRDALAEAVGTLRAALEASVRVQEHQQLLLDKIHAEKEELREAEQRRHRDPVLRDLIQLADTCSRTSRQWHAREDISRETAEKVSAALLDAAADVGLILERQGVEEFVPATAERFTRSEAKAVGTRPTTEPGLDGSVAEVRKPGYRLGERVLRFSEVVVWRLDTATPDPL